MDQKTLDQIILDDIHAAVDLVRGAGKYDPIVWLTGNSYMPPLRGWGRAEEVWQADDSGELWEEYAERWEEGVENNNIYVGCPDWDNALYGVDLTYWEYVDGSEDAETLGEEWARRGVGA